MRVLIYNEACEALKPTLDQLKYLDFYAVVKQDRPDYCIIHKNRHNGYTGLATTFMTLEYIKELSNV